MATEPSDLGRGAWIALAAKVLRQEGPSALTIARLAAREGRDETAFRDHFKSIGALILALAETWSDREALEIARAAGAGDTPVARLWSLLATTGAADPDFERGLRALAADYTEVGDVIRAADDRRELILTTLLAGTYGLEGSEAHHHARLLQALHIATLTRPRDEVAAYVSGAVRALTALLESNFPID